MSKRANPTAIGLFVLVGLLLTITSIVYVGSLKLFAKEETFVLYFDASINGLSVGAPVKFKGVPVGKVTDIRIRWNQTNDSDAVPVFIEIDIDNLINRLGVEVDLSDDSVYRQQVVGGLRGQLILESFITGLLFIELDYRDNPGPPVFYQREEIFKEIPTVQSALAEIGQTATTIFERINALDVEAINDELIALLRNANDAIGELRLGELNDEAIETLAAVRELVKSQRLTTILDNLDGAISDLRTMVQSVDAEVQPLVARLTNVAEDLSQTLQAAQGTLGRADMMLDPDAPLLLELQYTLQEVSRAAEAATILFDTIERNPTLFISGKAPPE